MTRWPIPGSPEDQQHRREAVESEALHKDFWTYKAPPTPLAPEGTSQREWESLSPGMRREIMRSRNRMRDERDERRLETFQGDDP